jgi:ABC-type nitrate/sulfonate/bicarbonate transport system permease component
VSFAIAWEAFARRAHSLLLPSFSATILALARLLTLHATWEAIWVSNQALLGGYFLAAAAGVPLGLLTGRVPRAGRWLDIYLNTLIVTPVSALVPLFIIATGLGVLSRVLVVFVFAFAVIAINAQAGVVRIHSSFLDMARSFGAREPQLWRYVLLPGALPAIAAGLRLGLGRAITGMVVVELLLVAVGVGRLIMRFQGDFESAKVYGVILIVLAESMILTSAVRALERRLSFWEPDGAIE